jgi:hypothetical protein
MSAVARGTSKLRDRSALVDSRFPVHAMWSTTDGSARARTFELTTPRASGVEAGSTRLGVTEGTWFCTSIAVDELAVKHAEVCVVDNQLAGVSASGAQISNTSGFVGRLARDVVALAGKRDLPASAAVEAHAHRQGAD